MSPVIGVGIIYPEGLLSRQKTTAEEENVDSFDVNPKSGRWNVSDTGQTDDQIVEGNLRLTTTSNMTGSPSEYFAKRGLRDIDSKIEYRYKMLLDNQSEAEYGRDMLGDQWDWEVAGDDEGFSETFDTDVVENGLWKLEEGTSNSSTIFYDIDSTIPFVFINLVELKVRVNVSTTFLTYMYSKDGTEYRYRSAALVADTWTELQYNPQTTWTFETDVFDENDSWYSIKLETQTVDLNATTKRPIKVEYDYIKVFMELEHATHVESGDAWDWYEGDTEGWDAGTLKSSVDWYEYFNITNPVDFNTTDGFSGIYPFGLSVNDTGPNGNSGWFLHIGSTIFNTSWMQNEISEGDNSEYGSDVSTEGTLYSWYSIFQVLPGEVWIIDRFSINGSSYGSPTGQVGIYDTFICPTSICPDSEYFLNVTSDAVNFSEDFDDFVTNTFLTLANRSTDPYSTAGGFIELYLPGNEYFTVELNNVSDFEDGTTEQWIEGFNNDWHATIVRSGGIWLRTDTEDQVWSIKTNSLSINSSVYTNLTFEMYVNQGNITLLNVSDLEGNLLVLDSTNYLDDTNYVINYDLTGANWTGIESGIEITFTGSQVDAGVYINYTSLLSNGTTLLDEYFTDEESDRLNFAEDTESMLKDGIMNINRRTTDPYGISGDFLELWSSCCTQSLPSVWRTGLSIDASIYDQLSVRWIRSDLGSGAVVVNMTIRDANSGNQVGFSDNSGVGWGNGTWYVTDFDLSLDADWTGTETALEVEWALSGNIINSFGVTWDDAIGIDYIWLGQELPYEVNITRTGLSIPANIYTNLTIKWIRSDTIDSGTSVDIVVYDGDGNQIGSSGSSFANGTWYTTSIDLSLDSDWTGTESGLTIKWDNPYLFTNGGYNWTDSIGVDWITLETPSGNGFLIPNNNIYNTTIGAYTTNFTWNDYTVPSVVLTEGLYAFQWNDTGSTGDSDYYQFPQDSGNDTFMGLSDGNYWFNVDSDFFFKLRYKKNLEYFTRVKNNVSDFADGSLEQWIENFNIDGPMGNVLFDGSRWLNVGGDDGGQFGIELDLSNPFTTEIQSAIYYDFRMVFYPTTTAGGTNITNITIRDGDGNYLAHNDTVFLAGTVYDIAFDLSLSSNWSGDESGLQIDFDANGYDDLYINHTYLYSIAGLNNVTIYRDGFAVASTDFVNLTMRWIRSDTRADATVANITILDADGNQVGFNNNSGLGFANGTWYVTQFNLSADSDWTGTETELRIIWGLNTSVMDDYSAFNITWIDSIGVDWITLETTGQPTDHYSGIIQNIDGETVHESSVAIDTSIFTLMELTIDVTEAMNMSILVQKTDDPFWRELTSVELNTTLQTFSFNMSSFSLWTGIVDQIALSFTQSGNFSQLEMILIYSIYLFGTGQREQEFIIGFWDENNGFSLMNMTQHWWNFTAFRWEVELFDDNQELAAYYYSDNQTLGDAGIAALDSDLFIESFSGAVSEWNLTGSTPYLLSVDGTSYISTDNFINLFVDAITNTTTDWSTAGLSPFLDLVDGSNYINAFGEPAVNENLFVDAYVNVTDEWDETGSDPWLGAVDGSSFIESNNEHILYVDGWTNTSDDWYETGSSPYLESVDGTSYISADNSSFVQSWFTFENTSISYVSGYSVLLEIYVTAGDGNDNLLWDIDTDGDNTSDFTGTIGSPTSGWYISSLSTVSTKTDINNLRLTLTVTTNGAANNITVDSARLRITRDDLNTRWYTFANTTSAHTENFTTSIHVYLLSTDGSDDLEWEIDTSGDNTAECSGTFTNPVTGWNTESVTCVTTSTQINNARLSLNKTIDGAAGNISIDAARLNIVHGASGSLDDLIHRWFTFANTSVSYDADYSTQLGVYVLDGNGNDDIVWGIDINSDNTSDYTGTIQNPTSGWYYVDLSAITTKSAINMVRVSFSKVNGSLTPGNMTIDASKLLIYHNDLVSRWYSFADTSTGHNDSITTILGIYVLEGDGDDDLRWNIDTTGDDLPECSGFISNPTSGWYLTNELDLETCIDTKAEVNAARLSITKSSTGVSNVVKVDAAKLTITHASTLDESVCFNLYCRATIKYDILKSEFEVEVSSDEGTDLFDVDWTADFTVDGNPALFAYGKAPRLFISTFSLFYGHQEVWIDFIEAKYKEADWAQIQDAPDPQFITEHWQFAEAEPGVPTGGGDSQESQWRVNIPRLDSFALTYVPDHSNYTLQNALTTDTAALHIKVYAVDWDDGELQQLFEIEFRMFFFSLATDYWTSQMIFRDSAGSIVLDIAVEDTRIVDEGVWPPTTYNASPVFSMSFALQEERSKAAVSVRYQPDEEQSFVSDVVRVYEVNSITSAASQEFAIEFDYEFWTASTFRIGTLRSLIESFDFIERDLFEDIFNFVVDAVGGILQPFVDFLAGIFIAMFRFLVEALFLIVTPIVDGIGAIFTAVVNALSATLEAALELLGPIMQAAIGALEPILQGIIDAFDPLLEILDDLLGDLIDLLSTLLQDVIDGLVALAVQIWDVLIEVMEDIIEAVLPFIGQIFDAIVNVVIPIFADIWDQIWTAIFMIIDPSGGLKAFVDGIFQVAIPNFISSFISLFTAMAALISFLFLVMVFWIASVPFYQAEDAQGVIHPQKAAVGVGENMFRGYKIPEVKVLGFGIGFTIPIVLIMYLVMKIFIATGTIPDVLAGLPI